MADSNLAKLSYRVESIYDEAPAGANELTVLRYTGESLSFDITNTSSQEIRSDRAPADLIQTGAALSGGFNFELSRNSFDDFFAGTMYSQWQTPFATTAYTTISFRADTNANNMNSSVATQFTNCKVGQWLLIVGIGAATNFTFHRVTAMASATSMTVLPAPASTQAAGSSIFIFGSCLKNGITESSFAFERLINMPTGTSVYFQFGGMIVSQMSMSVKSDAIVTGTFDFMGATPGVATTTAYSATQIAANTRSVLNATSNVGGVFEGGMSAENQISDCLLQGIDFSINNNLRAIRGIGRKSACDIGVGEFSVTGTINAYFASKNLYQKYIDGTESMLTFRVTEPTGIGYAFTFPRIKFETDKVNVSGSNQDVMENITFKALYDATSDCVFQIDRF